MHPTDLASAYRHYIACLNQQDWPNLGRFVAPQVRHNGKPLGLAGYQAMLEGNYRDIPDLRFHIEQLACDPPWVASRLIFRCTPAGSFLGLAVNGKHVVFSENVFYQFDDGKIVEVWSVVDRAAIEQQL